MNVPVNIHHISYRFKSVKRNTYGQKQFGPFDGGFPAKRQQPVEVFNEKIAVFKIDEKAYINKYWQRKQQLPLKDRWRYGHPFYDMEINKSGGQYYEYKFRRSPGIKENTEYKDHKVFKPFTNQVIGKKKCRKEIQKENNAAQYHIGRKIEKTGIVLC